MDHLEHSAKSINPTCSHAVITGTHRFFFLGNAALSSGNGPFWSISEQQGWLSQDGSLAIWQTPSQGFALVETRTGNNMWFSF